MHSPISPISRSIAPPRSTQTTVAFATILLWISFLTARSPLMGAPSAPEIPVYTVVVDPGHGGTAINQNDDKWDSLSQSYLEHFNVGMSYENLSEYHVMMDLGRLVQKYLDLTATDEGWSEFESMLRKFSSEKNFRRIRFRALLSRNDSFDDHKGSTDNPEVNAPYRLYDYPDPKHKNRMLPGRISYINQQKPYLVLSLHMNPALGKHPGGMAAVLSPGYPTFEELQKISLKKISRWRFRFSPWYRKTSWLITDEGWDVTESAIADSWVYFNGYRSTKDGLESWLEKDRGYRWNMVDWIYRDAPGWEKVAKEHGPGPYALKHADYRAEGPFWDRERAKPEYWKREDGYLGFGGDNYYASDELMRFVQYGVRLQVPSMRSRKSIGQIQPPYVSAYSVPILVNAISAYIEIGYLNRDRDRKVIIGQMDAVARSLAVGIYSLFADLKVTHKYSSPYHPRGKALNFRKYETLPGGNYFNIVTN